MGFLYALWIIPILLVLILLHEIGHFVMARRAGVRVEEFGIGLPPRVWGVKRGDTIYSINAIPVGGFVKVLGEDGKSFAKDSMQAKTPGQRARFLVAGSVMNFLAAFFMIGLLVAFQGESSQRIYVTEVVPDSPAESAGWQAGDRFVKINGEHIESDSQVVGLTTENAGSVMDVTLERAGELVETTIIPRENPPVGEGRTGIRIGSSVLAEIRVSDVPEGSTGAGAGFAEGDIIHAMNGIQIADYLMYSMLLEQHVGEEVVFDVERDGQTTTLTALVPSNLPSDSEPLGMGLIRDVKFERVPVLQIPLETVRMSITWTTRLVDGFVILITGQASFNDVAGPIGMGQLTSEIISESAMPLWVTITTLAIILSLNLGLLNLLPLPALDGGRLMFVFIEFLRRGKRVSPEKEGLVHFVGIAILLSFMLVIAFRDVDRIFSGRSFLQ